MDYIHFWANLISGLSFWIVSYFFTLFIDILKIRITQNPIDKEGWVNIYKYNSLFSILSAVFFFCGFGHIAESFRPWTKDYGQMIVIHCCTASLGFILCVSLIYYTFLTKNK